MSSRFSHLEFSQPPEHTTTFTGSATSRAETLETEALTAFEMERFEEALRLYSRILDFDARSRSSWTGQVFSLIQSGDPNSSYQWAARAVEEFPDDSQLRALLAITLVRKQRLIEAQALSDDIRSPDLLTWIARMELQLARKDGLAEHCQNQALAAESDSWKTPWLLSRSRTQYGQHAAALKLAREAITRMATHSTPWLQQSRCEFALGLREKAMNSIHRARELAPDSEVIAGTLRTFQATPRGLRRFFPWIGGHRTI